jgi:hypothetical protein
MLFNTNLLPQTKETFEGKFDKIEKYAPIKPSKFYDHFVTKGYEYLILDVQSVLGGAENILKEHKFITNFSEPFELEQLFLAFRETSEPDTYKQKHNIVMCVYFFQNPNSELEFFFDYYHKQGIEKIFMFYCGKSENRPNLPTRDFVEYLSFDYTPFWILNPKTKQRAHYLQIPLYNIFVKKISPHCSWTIFCDLDEFIYSLNHKSIKLHLEKASSHLLTNHRWAKVKFNNNQISYENKTSSPIRAKNVLKGTLIKPPDIIKIHEFSESEDKCSIDENLLMFHNILASKTRKPRFPFFNRTLFWKKIFLD